MSKENAAIVRRYFEAVNQRSFHLLDERFTPDFIDHAAPADTSSSVEALKRFFAMMESGFPDFHIILEAIIAEGNSVAARFTFTGTHTGEFMGTTTSTDVSK